MARSKATGPMSGCSGRRVLHLDPFSGAAGNMFLAAMLDAGLPRRKLKEALDGLGVEHRLVVRRVKRGSLSAPYLDVKVPKPRRGHHHPHRHYDAIRRLLDGAKLEAPVRDQAQAIFAALAKAEARVHGIPIEKVHFHEVGAVDAIVDITGAAIAVHAMGIERVSVGPVALGQGTVETEHGRLPLPAPATLELLRGVPTVPAHVGWETITPTGAAILRTLGDEFTGLPAMTIEAIGHGAGNDRPGPLPNLLRVVIGRESGGGADRVVCLETNLDDLVPEHFDHVMEQLLEAGALDVSILHQQTKKNRPGFLLRVLTTPAERIPLATRLLSLTGSLGVRSLESDRLILPREIRRVDTRFGKIRVKFVTAPDGSTEVSAEYDDCKRAALRAKRPLGEVVREAEEVARNP
ncbi:MAG: nickel pincer cofactor biosynthesis protein LarC [bacterium]|nr:nickel pincer cofactor biosynthesis protein LarC [bacterium]